MGQGFGAYGKMPNMGDFFRIGLPRCFCDPWDKWLQSALVSSRTVLGGAWQDSYMSAPIWRFSFGAGVTGPHSALGVLMPSVDKVGRAFPLTLAGLDVGEQSSDQVFAQLEEIALAALEDDMTKAHLAQALAQVDFVNGTVPNQHTAKWSAILADQELSFTGKGLPDSADALRLFDMKTWMNAPTNKEVQA